MSTKSFRVTISFDVDKEADIIEQLEGLADKRQLGSILSNLIRLAYDGSSPTSKSLNLNTSTLSPTRQQFFNELSQKVQAQDKRIDEIYSMCEDLYGLARANKAIGLEDKASNLMLSQFVLQRQQDKLKRILGEDNVRRLYESDRLLNESEKADKVWDFIAGVYESMIEELRPIHPIVPSNQIVQSRVSCNSNLNPPNQNITTPADHFTNNNDGDDEIIDLVEKPKDHTSNKQLNPSSDIATSLEDIGTNEEEISIPTGDRAKKLLAMMKKKEK